MAVCRSPHPLSVFVLCAFLLALCLPWQQTLAADARQAHAAPSVPAATAGPEASPSGEAAALAVRLDGLPVLTLQRGTAAMSLEERAELIGKRLQRLADDRDFSASALRIDTLDDELLVRYGDTLVMTVTTADAEAAGVAREALAAQYLGALRKALDRAHAEHGLDALLRAGAYTLAALAGLWVVLRGFGWAVQRLRIGVRWAERRQLLSLRIQKAEILPADRVARALDGAIRVLRLGGLLIIFYLFTSLVLSFFPGTRGLSGTVIGWVLDPLRNLAYGIVRFLPDLFVIIITIMIMRALIGLVKAVFKELGSGKLKWGSFDPELALPTYKIVRFFMIIFTGVLIFPYLPGSDSDAFKGASVFLGLLLSLGSSSAVSNIIAGVVLTYTRAFSIGDYVRVGEHTGDVIEHSLLVTRLRTIKNVEIALPNGHVLSNPISNYSAMAASKQLILHTTVAIGYEVPWRDVHWLLIEAARRTEGLLHTPSPFVLQEALGDFYVSYQINAYTDRARDQVDIYAWLRQNIQDCFNEAGIEILSPHYHAVRDGGTLAMPASARPDGYRPPGFRMAVEPADPAAARSPFMAGAGVKGAAEPGTQA